MLAQDILFKTAEKTPEAPAVWFQNEWRTYGQLATEARAFSKHLVTTGIKPGDTVALLIENSFDYIIAHFGTLAAGAIEVSLNTDLKAPALTEILTHCEAKVLVTSKRHTKLATEIVGNGSETTAFQNLQVATLRPPCPGVSMSSRKTTACPSKLDERSRVHRKPEGLASAVNRPLSTVHSSKPPGLASIVYTSGSTGHPKGVMLSHRNLTSNTESIVDYLELCPDDRMLVILPFHYIYGRSLLYSHFLSGGSLVVDNRFAFPSAVVKTIREQEVTCLAGVPSTFSILLRKTDLGRHDLPHLRLLTQAGGPMAPSLQKEVVETFQDAKLYVMYGSTEAAPRLTFVDPEDLPHKWGSIGKAIPGVEVYVSDPDGNRLAQGATGEVAARGPNIMLGYLKDPEGTDQVLRNGIYFTGDLGYEDEDGFIFLTGRSRDMIKVGGNRISAKEVEETILESADIHEVAVIGVSDEILGESLVAHVVPENGELEERELKRFLEQRLPSFKIPQTFIFRDSLPKNSSGKILKQALREEKSSTKDTKSHEDL